MTAVHELTTTLDPLPLLIHAACSCGTLFVAVPAEVDAREGVVAERHRIHVEQHRPADAQRCLVTDPNTIHVLPVNDLIEHEDDSCACLPTTEAVPRDDGSTGWLVVHNAWDGRS